MAKVKVRVLYPTGFEGLKMEVKGSDVVELDEATAKTVVDVGWAEYVQAKVAAKKATA